MYLKNEGGLGAEQGETFVGKVVISPLDANVLVVVRIRQETLMEDSLLDDDIEIELAPIAVQLAYVQQLLGHKQEAIEAYTDIINRDLADESSLAVAVNNLIALKVYANRVLLLLHANRLDQGRELVAALSDMFADSVMPVLLQAAVFVRENKAVRAEEVLGQFAEKFPDKSKVVLLARAQVAAAAGHPQIAAESLAKMAPFQSTKEGSWSSNDKLNHTGDLDTIHWISFHTCEGSCVNADLDDLEA
ncbi:hypothetical protein CMV_020769 [Castanea mollissima]|uniref:Uncharacterized protein n=1 Tax=Castanea mollissima TaxID=60419 RepID=A0A8J4R095_9ROSI|nr:hypothetical protein CMV_020769 [Castanea mollissima]